MVAPSLHVGHFTSFDCAMASCCRWENFALLLNGFTVPDSSESGAMWFSCENPANFLRIWNRLR
jgi:hypothetical protein